MPGSATLKYYFELLPMDPTGDYTRHVLSCQSMLRVQRLNTHLIRKDQWYDYQRRLVLRNGSASKNAKLHIGRAYGKAIGSYCVKPIHDLSAADPFSEMTQHAIYEFGRCNL